MAGLGRPLIRWAGAALCASLLAVTTTLWLHAQFNVQPQFQPQSAEEILRGRLPHEPQIRSEVNDAQELIKSQNFEAAIDILQPLLEEGEDFFEIESEDIAESSLDRIEALLRNMPPEAITTYRRRYEPLAAQRLAQARGRGEMAELLEVARLYPLTFAAREATDAAGEIAFDQGETALAARLWGRLLPGTEAGPERTTRLIRIAQAWTLASQPEQAVAYAKELSALAQTSPIEYEGKLLSPPESGDTAWLNKVFGPVKTLVPHREDDWRLGGGHPRRWSDGPLVSTLQRGRWARPLIDPFDVYDAGVDEKFLTILKFLETKYLRNDHQESSKTLPLIIGSPLVNGDTVLVQGVGALKAFDAHTGEIRWSGVVEDDTFLYWSRRNFAETGTNPTHDRLVELYLGQRAWLNQAGASLASDETQVYAISGTGMVGATPPQNMFMRRAQPSRHELTPPSDNRLLAYDIESGLLKWETGGPSVGIQVDEEGNLRGDSRRLSGAFFLGAPLAVDGQLFVLAEDRGQIRLFSLSPETGEAVWSLPLLNPDNPIAYNYARRMYGLSPSYAGGLLICPTGDGLVVAVDPQLRRMKWFSQYQARLASADPRQAMMLQIRNQRLRNGNDSQLETMLRERRWFDGNPILTAGRIVLPTPDNNMLYCLDLESGKTLWELPRKEGLFVAACTERQCIVVGQRSIQAFNLSDGKEKWSREIPVPTGRGVVSGGQYLLPVATHEILSIQMKTGQILARSTIDPAHTAGSLVAAGDQLLMQTTSEIVGLKPLSEMSREITQQLNDAGLRASALAEQGELFLFQGREDEAVAMLKESLQLQESASTRRMLVWSQLERLKADYASSQSLVADLKRTITDPDQRRLLNRLNAEGLERSGNSLAAFREYLDLVKEVGQSDDLMELSFVQRVRDDRWLRGRLTHLRNLADEPQRQQMRQSLVEVIAALEPAFRQHYASVLGIELAPELHLNLALTNGLDPFKSERILWTLSESRDPALRGPAVAKLLRQELAQKRTTYITHLLKELQHSLAAVECEPGLTGTALLEQLRKEELSERLLQGLDLPGKVPAFNPRSAGASIPQRDVFPCLGSRRGPYAEWIFSAEFNPTRNVQCCDGSGRVRYTLNLDSLGQMSMRQLRYVQTDPQLVLLAFRDRFAVISPMDAGGNQFQTRFQYAFNPVVDDGFNRTQVRPATIKPAVRDVVYPLVDGSYLGNVGPLSYDTLCFISGDELFAVQPQLKDSKLQWKRTGVAPGSEICADSEYVVLIPPLLDRLVVIRSADGELIADRAMPKGRVERKRADWGRLFLVKRSEPGAGTGLAPGREIWAMYDPVTDKDAWSISLAAGTEWSPVDGEDLAFLEPDGTLHLVDDQSGQVTWTAKMPAQTVPPENFTIHTDEDRVYVQTWHRPAATQDKVTEYAPPAGNPVPVNGLVVALDRRGGQVLWSREVEQQLFRPNLPVGSGVLAYSAQRRHEPVEGEQREGPNTYQSMQFLSRSTGEPILAKERVATLGTGEGWARLPSGAMLLRLSGHDFRLTWDAEATAEELPPPQNEPVPPRPAAPVKPL